MESIKTTERANLDNTLEIKDIKDAGLKHHAMEKIIAHANYIGLQNDYIDGDHVIIAIGKGMYRVQFNRKNALAKNLAATGYSDGMDLLDMEIDSMEDGIEKFSKFFNLDKPLKKNVFIAAIQDSTYRKNLMISQKTPSFLNHLLNNPPVLNNLNVLSWEKIISHRKMFRLYLNRYRSYFQVLKGNNTNSKPCKPIAEIHPADFRETYLDHNATTYIRPEVSELLVDYYSGKYDFGANTTLATPAAILFRAIILTI